MSASWPIRWCSHQEKNRLSSPPPIRNKNTRPARRLRRPPKAQIPPCQRVGRWLLIEVAQPPWLMIGTTTKPKIKDEIKVERPRLHKVILVNDDFTPREFVVIVLKAEFRMSEDQALRVMMTAHRRGLCGRRLNEGCSGSQGNERDGRRPAEELSSVVHDRAGGISPQEGAFGVRRGGWGRTPSMTDKFTLHGSPHSLPTYRVALMLRLCRTGFAFRYVSFQRGMQLTPKFRALSRWGQAPVLEHGGRVFVQSAAILEYLAKTLGCFNGTHVEARQHVREWLFWDADRLMPPLWAWYGVELA